MSAYAQPTQRPLLPKDGLTFLVDQSTTRGTLRGGNRTTLLYSLRLHAPSSLNVLLP